MLMSRDRRLARDWVVPAVACAAYLAIGLVWLRFVYLSDFFQMVWLADAQRQGVATAFANGFLGMGYPLVLNGLRSLTGNILTSGKIVQALSGGAILAMLPLLSRQAFGDAKGSRLAQVLLAVDAVFLFAAAGETPDLLATAFMIGGLAVAAAYIAQPSARLAFGAGVLVGVGYLVRYHALLLLPWLMIAMAALAKERRRTVLWALAGFALAASPQLIASGMIQGNPLFNLHIKSVSMGYCGVSSDFVEKTRPYTLVSVITKDPAHVFKQYVGFVIRYFTEIGGGLLLLAGAVLARRNELRGWSLLALPAMALTLLLAAKFYTDRAILFQLVVWYVVIGRTLAHLMAAGEAATTRLIAVTLALALSGSSIVQAGRTWSRFASLERRNVEITQILRANRIGSSREVFTTHLSVLPGRRSRRGTVLSARYMAAVRPGIRERLPSRVPLGPAVTERLRQTPPDPVPAARPPHGRAVRHGLPGPAGWHTGARVPPAQELGRSLALRVTWRRVLSPAVPRVRSDRTSRPAGSSRAARRAIPAPRGTMRASQAACLARSRRAAVPPGAGGGRSGPPPIPSDRSRAGRR